MSKTVVDAIKDVRLRQHAMQMAQEELLEEIDKFYEDETESFSMAQTLEELMDNELRIARELRVKIDEVVKLISSDTEISAKKPTNFIHPSLKEQRLPEMLTELPRIWSKVFLQEEEIPTNYKNELKSSLPTLGEAGEYWGSSSPSIFSLGLVLAYFAVTGNSINDLSLDSPIIHVVPLPAEGFEFLSGSKLFYHKGEMVGYGIPHSGYAFGGSWCQESLYPKTKVFAPEEASSWVARMVGIVDVPFITITDLAYAHISLNGLGFRVPDGWLNDKLGENIIQKLQLVATQGIKPGDICLWFKIDQPERGGRAGIVVNKVGEQKIKVLTCERDFPQKEGFGLQVWPIISDKAGDKIGFLRSNNNLAQEEASSDCNLYDIISEVDAAVESLDASSFPSTLLGANSESAQTL